ncbi:metallophosphoesterase [Aquibacillus koreensis]|uniref:Metallophosphoesterase n=1 Tax=Aquibacillus koreensis TaxID=279446 RepID=A0A9X4AJS9_9BACI|nr:metallophosphoesterase [Aquibacillus koreensis]MCT2534332.1 metallophosphoesterase [Aquibacillus koreensis]MDC3420653.1 metallophosphoesterase [Aquibacillus koreensis]
MNRRTFLKRLLTSSVVLLGSGGGTYYYAREIEPSMLTILKKTLTSVKIPQTFNGFKIVQFSDTHIGFHYTIDQFNSMIDSLNKLKPDCVVFTGDLVDMPHKYGWGDPIVQSLQKIQAPHGKFWVYGNHDHGGYGTDIIKDVMEQGGFTLLQNEHTIISKKNESITLAGLDDAILGKPDIEVTLQDVAPDSYTVLLVHEPDYADRVIQFPVDVQLSGHSHGGQIQIPFYGYVYTPYYAEKYVEGKYTFNNHQLQLFVSRGIGTTRLPYRFFCKPEITVFTLQSTKGNS